MSLFHDNYDTPAAKIYHNEDGDVLFCFSEKRRYRVVDFIKKGLYVISDSLVSKEELPILTIKKMYLKIWKQLSDAQRKSLQDNYHNPIQVLPKDWDKYASQLDKFKEGQITYKQFLDLLLVALN